MTMLDRTAMSMTEMFRPAHALRGVLRNVASFLTAWKNRRQVYRLGQLTEWELADIGLTRADLSVVWQSPIGIDPTARLGVIAQARIEQDLRDAACRIAVDRATHAGS